MADDDDNDDDVIINAERQADEWEALEAVYGGDDGMVEKVTDTHWKITFTRESITGAICSSNSNSNSNSNDIVTLELRLNRDYPSSAPPRPSLKAPQWIVDDTRLKQWQEELLELWCPDTETVIVWVEHLKGLLLEHCYEMKAPPPPNSSSSLESMTQHHEDITTDKKNTTSASDDARSCSTDDDIILMEPPVVVSTKTSTNTTTTPQKIRTFVPPTSKYNQPIRSFDVSIIDSDDKKYATIIHQGKPFHPPKSGPSECMQAFVASVKSMEQVQWVMANLLFQNKKVAKATHNMMAYRFYVPKTSCCSSSISSTTTTTTTTTTTSTTEENGHEEGHYHNYNKSKTKQQRQHLDQHQHQQHQQQQQKQRNNINNNLLLLVSDNDDDGEKGSGMKLAALLDMADARDVIVVVSRWYGGIHLGPARFKWIASVARDALEEFGFL